MVTVRRLVLVAALLAIAFTGVALVAGYSSRSAAGESSDAAQAAPASGMGAMPMDEMPAGEMPAGSVPGVQVAQDGLRLVLERSMFARDAPSRPLSFRILDAEGRPVRDFEVQHEKRMHLIVVRRDLQGFQHLHPTMKPDGTWTVGLDFAKGGTYRVFADFTRGGQQRTLGADLQVSGSFQPRPLPAPEQVVRSDGGLEVELSSDAARPGKDARLQFEVRDQGRVVTNQLQPYLGAKGHLVALRRDDLAYLHTHAESDELAFTLNYPSAGAYRLFVQFRYEGRVRTAAFTQDIRE